MATKNHSKKTAPAAKVARPVKSETLAPVDYSTATNLHPDVLQAAGLRNGMTPEEVHNAIARVIG